MEASESDATTLRQHAIPIVGLQSLAVVLGACRPQGRPRSGLDLKVV